MTTKRSSSPIVGTDTHIFSEVNLQLALELAPEIGLTKQEVVRSHLRTELHEESFVNVMAYTILPDDPTRNPCPFVIQDNKCDDRCPILHICKTRLGKPDKALFLELTGARRPDPTNNSPIDVKSVLED